MPSQEEIGICEPTDNLNHIFSYESDLKSQLHPLYHQNGLTKQPSSQLNRGSNHTDNYSSHRNTHQLNFEAVRVCSAGILLYVWKRWRPKLIMKKKNKIEIERKKRTLADIHIISFCMRINCVEFLCWAMKNVYGKKDHLNTVDCRCLCRIEIFIDFYSVFNLTILLYRKGFRFP